MADQAKARQPGRLLGAAFGGPNPGWPEWYAAARVGFEPSVEQVADWLREGDERHRARALQDAWPQFYASLIVDSYATSA